MKIRSIRVQNYKSILDSGILEIGEKFTVIVGQNNVGKTSLLEGFVGSGIANKPYKSGNEDILDVQDPYSKINVDWDITGRELSSLIRTHNVEAEIITPPEMREPKRALAYFDEDVLPITHTVSMEFNQGWRNPQDQRPRDLPCVVFGASPDRKRIEVRRSGATVPNSLASLLTSVPNASYVFKAERLNISASGLQPNLELQPDARNLAGALSQLQGERNDIFEKLNEQVRSIIPNFERVSLVASTQNSSFVEIRILNKSYRQGYSLADCGTGIGQVLAILFVAMTSDHGRVIVIDEPNSFLHPSAARTLINVLKSYPRHQYVVASHAAEVISAAEPDKIIQVRWRDSQSKIEVGSGNDVTVTRSILDEVGARLSDVFGRDGVIWVEGKTEEICFPKIATHCGAWPAGRVDFVAILNTGDLVGKRRTLAWRIYDRLSQQSALMPEALAFSFDREDWTQQDLDDLVKQSNNRVKFLPRRAYENFLLHPTALSSVLPGIGSPGAVEAWIVKNGGKYYSDGRWNQDLNDGAWLRGVDAARLLTDLVAALTQNRERYTKTSHSPAITDWLLQRHPSHLTELVQYVGQLLAAGKSN